MNDEATRTSRLSGAQPRRHSTVGRKFRGLGGTYLCERYEAACGFWMRMLTKNDSGWNPGREPGDMACVSERAIGRTYHRIYDNEEPVKHYQPCECWECRGEEP